MKKYTKAKTTATIGNRIAPPRFLLFLFVLIAASLGSVAYIGWWLGLMAGFDIAAIVFLLSCLSLLSTKDAARIRVHAARNDSNRGLLLAITGIVMLIILMTVGAELTVGTKIRSNPASSALVIATLALAWLFSNSVYALHYAHLHYLQDKKQDRGGIIFPKTSEPDYWDFIYFAFTLGMTFQTSDVAITSGRIRRVVTFHCFAAFVYNLGVLAFTINVLGS
jgi:uncharacterized membrane protein